MKVTRIFQSKKLTQRKYDRLNRIAIELGKVRTDLWDRFGSRSGVGLSYMDIRNAWMKEKHVPSFIPARLWKATLRDVIGDITACREAAKVKARRSIHRRYATEKDTCKMLYRLLKQDTWTENEYLTRLMRKFWKRGHTSVKNQIICDVQSYSWFSYSGCGWIAVQSFTRGQRIAIPLNSTYEVTGTIRLILRDGKVEVHHLTELINDRPCGFATIGVDKGYTEAFTDSDGDRHGEGLGKILSAYSNDLKSKFQARSKLKALADKHETKKPKKAERIRQYNVGRKKLDKKKKRHGQRIRTLAFTAAHSLVNKAKVIVAEDLTKTISQKHKKKTEQKNIGRNQRRRLNSWVKGTLAEALDSVSLRRGATVVHVNAAYTSQTHHVCGRLGVRKGDGFYCKYCKVDIDSDVNAAKTILARLNDSEISLWTPYQQVKSILQARLRHSVETAQPGLELQRL